MSSTATRIIKNTGWLYAKMGITMFISLYTTRLILQGLGASDFGIYNIVGGAISMLGFLDSAMASATQRFMNYSEGEGDISKKKIIFNVSYYLHLGISTVVALLLTIAGFIFFNGILNIPDERITAAYIVYGSLIVSTVFTVMSVPYAAVLNSHENMKFYSLVGILESILKLTVAFACVYSNYDKLIIYGILMALVPIISRIVMRIYCHHYYSECHISFRHYYDKDTMKEMTSFAGWNFLGSSSSMIGNYGNGVVMNHFWGATLNAAMGIAGQLDGMLHTLSNNLLKALNPVITKSEGAGDRERMLNTAMMGSKLSFFLYSIICIPFFLEMPYILKLWLKDIPDWAIIFARLQLIRTLIEQYTCTFSSAINAEGHIANMNKVNMLLNFVPLLLNIVLFSNGCSPISLYVVNAIIFGIGLSSSKIYFIHKNCGMDYKKSILQLVLPLTIVFIIILIIGYGILAITENGFIQLFTISIVTMVLHLILYYTFVLNRHERCIVNSLFKPIK